MQSMLGKWNKWYQGITKLGTFRYGNTKTYRMAEDFLQGLEVEDWGCGLGGFKLVHQGKYIGIDGSKSPCTDKVVDLQEYRSEVEGIMMRHVLEHNYGWEKVLENAVQSFSKRMCLVIFTPFAEETKVIAQNIQHGVDVPDISFKRRDIEKHFTGLTWRMEEIKSRCHYGLEYIK